MKMNKKEYTIIKRWLNAKQRHAARDSASVAWEVIVRLQERLTEEYNGRKSD